MNLVEEIKIEHRKMLTRRHLFRDCGLGLGTMALAGLLGERTASARAGSLAGVDALAPKTPHFPGKAKRVIFLFMAGAPSQLDLFDSKPLLQKYNGKPAPAEFLKGQNFAFIKPDAALFASPLIQPLPRAFVMAWLGGSESPICSWMWTISKISTIPWGI